jgi:hypothetical protein
MKNKIYRIFNGWPEIQDKQLQNRERKKKVSSLFVFFSLSSCTNIDE